MYLFKMIIKSIRNNKSRYLILFFLIFLLNLLLFVSGKVYQYDVTKIESIKQDYGSEVRIDLNPDFSDYLAEGNKRVEPLTYEDYVNISKSRYVESTNYEQHVYVLKEKLPEVLSKANPTSILDFEGFANIIGYNDLEQSTDFKLGDETLTDGVFPKNDYEILLNKDLAEENGIKVGQYIDYIDENQLITRFKTVGFYSGETENDYYNIYTTYDTTQKISNDNSYVNAVYKLYSYKDYQAFQDELYANGLSKMYYVNNNENIIEDKTAPYYRDLNNISNSVNFFSILFLIIIVMISSSILNKKKNSLKTLRLLGTSKLKLMFISILEILIVTILSLIFIGIFLYFMDIFFLNFLIINPSLYVYIIRNMFITNLIIIILVNFETILFINGYNLDKIIAEGK